MASAPGRIVHRGENGGAPTRLAGLALLAGTELGKVALLPQATLVRVGLGEAGGGALGGEAQVAEDGLFALEGGAAAAAAGGVEEEDGGEEEEECAGEGDGGDGAGGDAGGLGGCGGGRGRGCRGRRGRGGGRGGGGGREGGRERGGEKRGGRAAGVWSVYVRWGHRGVLTWCWCWRTVRQKSSRR